MTRRRVYPLAKVYALLEPRPAVRVSCVISACNFSSDLPEGTKECVINILSAELIKAMFGVGNCSARKSTSSKNLA